MLDMEMAAMIEYEREGKRRGEQKDHSTCTVELRLGPTEPVPSILKRIKSHLSH